MQPVILGCGLPFLPTLRNLIEGLNSGRRYSLSYLFYPEKKNLSFFLQENFSSPKHASLRNAVCIYCMSCAYVNRFVCVCALHTSVRFSLPLVIGPVSTRAQRPFRAAAPPERHMPAPSFTPVLGVELQLFPLPANMYVDYRAPR